MTISDIIWCVKNIPNNITKTKFIPIEFIGGIKLYG